MSRYVTIGADEHGQVYGLEINEDGSFKRNPYGLATSCVVIRPVDRKTYDYVTEDPDSAKDLWKDCVQNDRTEKGLEDWFEEYAANSDLFDVSFVEELLNDDRNPTIREHDRAIKEKINEFDDESDEIDEETFPDSIWDEDGQPMSFQRRVELTLIESEDVPCVNTDDDVFHWESSGFFSPEKPFVIEFAPHDLIEEYYAHLRETCKEFKE